MPPGKQYHAEHGSKERGKEDDEAERAAKESEQG